MYGTISQADQYFTDTQFSNWETLTEDQKTSALLIGSSILDAVYAHRFPGKKTGGFEQTRQWPRVDAVARSGEEIPSSLVPTPIIQASFELAKNEILSPGSILKVSINSQQVKRQKLDILEREFFKNEASVKTDQLPYLPLIEGMIFDFLTSTEGGFPVFWVR